MKIRILKFGVLPVAIAALTAAYAWGPKWHWTRTRVGAGDAASKTDEAPTEVVIPDDKFKTMKITCLPVTRRLLQDERTVPGQIEYRRVRRVELKAPVDSFVDEVLVKPGDAVERGTRLAVLTSPDVGLARAEVEKSESELRIANQALEWAEEITRNLNDLLKFLRDKPGPQVVENAFDDKLLGEHRQAVLPTYSKYRLAEQLWDSVQQGIKSGSLPENKIKQYGSNREVAKEEFLSVCEQSRFEARQAREKARQSQNYGRRLVDVSQQKLRTLLGSFSEVSEAAGAAEEGNQLSHFYLIAPFEGTVEERLASDSQRVTAGTLLFAVANIDTLEVSADIREGDWKLVAQYFGDDRQERLLKVVVPALGEEREFEARVDYVGRMVDPQTKAVPLVALLDNSRHEFKPGMFAWIKVPAGKAEEELVVPPAALRTHDKQDFVFVADDKSPRRFVRVDVTVGRRTPELVTIDKGLTAGQRVVVDGAFLLKSELLLAPEEE